jgi:hypothetical protein
MWRTLNSELFALIWVLPIWIIPAPDSREPLGDIHLYGAGDQGSEVAIELGGVEHGLIGAVLQQDVFDDLEVGGTER